MSTASADMTPPLSPIPPPPHSDLQRISLWLPTVLVAVSMVIFLVISFIMYHYRHVKRKRAALDYLQDHDDIIRSSHNVQPFSVSDTYSDFENATFDLVIDGGERFVSTDEQRQRTVGETRSGGGATDPYGGQCCGQGTSISSPRGQQLCQDQLKTGVGCSSSFITYGEGAGCKTLESRQENMCIRQTEVSMQSRNGIDSNRMCSNEYVDVEATSTDELIAPIEVHSPPADDVFIATRYKQNSEADNFPCAALHKEHTKDINHTNGFHWDPTMNNQSKNVAARRERSSCDVSDVLNANQHTPLCVVCLVTQATLRPVGVCSSCSNMKLAGNVANVLSLIGREVVDDDSSNPCPTSSASHLSTNFHKTHSSLQHNGMPSSDNGGCHSFSSRQFWNPCSKQDLTDRHVSHLQQNHASSDVPKSFGDGGCPSSLSGFKSSSVSPKQPRSRSVSSSNDNKPDLVGIASSNSSPQSSQNQRSLDERHILSEGTSEVCIHQTGQSMQDRGVPGNQAHRLLSTDCLVSEMEGMPSPGTSSSVNLGEVQSDSSIITVSETPLAEHPAAVSSMPQAMQQASETVCYDDSIFSATGEQCVSPAFSDNFCDLPPPLWDTLYNNPPALCSKLKDAVPLARVDSAGGQKPATCGHRGGPKDNDGIGVVNGLESQWLGGTVNEASYTTYF